MFADPSLVSFLPPLSSFLLLSYFSSLLLLRRPLTSVIPPQKHKEAPEVLRRNSSTLLVYESDLTALLLLSFLEHVTRSSCVARFYAPLRPVGRLGEELLWIESRVDIESLQIFVEIVDLMLFVQLRVGNHLCQLNCLP